MPAQHRRFNSDDETDPDDAESSPQYPEVEMSESTSSSDDEAAPETITVQAGKAGIEAMNESLESHRLRILAKQKAANRTKEAAIRERKGLLSSRKGKMILPPDDEDNSDGQPNGNVNESGSIAQLSDGESNEDGDDNTSSSDSDGMSENEALKHSLAAPYLTDSIFAAAGSAATSSRPTHQPSKHENTKPQHRVHVKRRHLGSSSRTGEKVIGSRIIRSAATAEQIGQQAGLKPSRYTQKFIKSSERPKKGRWERRTARLTTRGIQGPPREFAR
ncbi:hypothetical protein FRC03_011833 [Tulasnella sp. 419]|nr:hypothetical protein FRC02_000122 [Tulasnella sp. 418]KAG8970034.1 hypothetical protein FRC03_011833 [Tulasnella sp. 419]